MFNAERKLRKYETVEDVIDEFYVVRMETYRKRKVALIEELERKLIKLSNRAKFILANLDGSIDLRKKTAIEVNGILTSRGFAEIDGDFKYLIKMPMDSVTEENVANIIADRDNSQKELDILLATSLEKMWIGELDVLEREYDTYKLKRQHIQSGSQSQSQAKAKAKVKK
jgi:DNA topoisomerase-2